MVTEIHFRSLTSFYTQVKQYEPKTDLNSVGRDWQQKNANRYMRFALEGVCVFAVGGRVPGAQTIADRGRGSDAWVAALERPLKERIVGLLWKAMGLASHQRLLFIRFA
ncbi:hypothetical protein [Paraburkholderia sp. BL10I2N1]|uniref:hypothetical protein n=1 Tax=Paraburkholderia sp. BL10I2N1 TaxID=1938796 RepID=UPI00105DC03F|nr:hypothetical protein [Paraburkholderia sp. BL10I2N1]